MKNKKWYVVIILLSFSASIYLLTIGNGEISFYKLYILPMIIWLSQFQGVENEE